MMRRIRTRTPAIKRAGRCVLDACTTHQWLIPAVVAVLVLIANTQ